MRWGDFVRACQAHLRTFAQIAKNPYSPYHNKCARPHKTPTCNMTCTYVFNTKSLPNKRRGAIHMTYHVSSLKYIHVHVEQTCTYIRRRRRTFTLPTSFLLCCNVYVNRTRERERCFRIYTFIFINIFYDFLYVSCTFHIYLAHSLFRMAMRIREEKPTVDNNGNVDKLHALVSDSSSVDRCPLTLPFSFLCIHFFYGYLIHIFYCHILALRLIVGFG